MPQSECEMGDLNQWLLYLVPIHFSQGFVMPVFKRLHSLSYRALLNTYLYIYLTCTNQLSILPYFIGNFPDDFGYMGLLPY